MTFESDYTTGGRETVRDLLVDAERRLTNVGVPSPNVDAAEIIAYALGTTRGRMILQDPVNGEQRVAIEQMLTKRLTRVPLQHLVGSTGFRHLDIAVGPGVFIPRPETELVAEAAIRELAEQPVPSRIAVDLCAGSGAIAIALGTEVDHSRVYAVELSDDAIGWTQRNVAAYDQQLTALGSRVEVFQHDATTAAEPDGPLSRFAGQVSVVVTNPPYIPVGMIPREPEVRDHEPRMALYGGDDGLDVVRGVLRTAAILLKPGGLLVVEHADVQGPDAGMSGVPGVARAMTADHIVAAHSHTAAGAPVWTDVVDRMDFNRLPRFTICRRTGA